MHSWDDTTSSRRCGSTPPTHHFRLLLRPLLLRDEAAPEGGVILACTGCSVRSVLAVGSWGWGMKQGAIQPPRTRRVCTL